MLYNGKKINTKNIIFMIEESITENWPNADIYDETIVIYERMVQGYEGVLEDLDYIVTRLKEKNSLEINLQTIEKIIMYGQWNFGQWEENIKEELKMLENKIKKVIKMFDGYDFSEISIEEKYIEIYTTMDDNSESGCQPLKATIYTVADEGKEYVGIGAAYLYNIGIENSLEILQTISNYNLQTYREFYGTTYTEIIPVKQH